MRVYEGYSVFIIVYLYSSQAGNTLGNYIYSPRYPNNIFFFRSVAKAFNFE